MLTDGQDSTGWRSASNNGIARTISDVVAILAEARDLVYCNEEIVAPPYEESFLDASLIPDFDLGVKMILRAKEENKKVAIYGDYDVDGVTSSAILAETFEKIGINTQVILPHREDDGYGLNSEAVKKIAKLAEILVTIDNGTSAHEAIDLAVKEGMSVLVIDHHVVSATLPNALVVNPHRTDSNYAFPDLCAAGLAFKFARALLAYFDREDEAKWLMDLAALGTIADRVPMKGENRHIVRFGLKVLAVTRRLGLIALMARAGLYKNNLEAENLAFKIIPRLNAAGRMQHADLAYALVRAKDHLEAEKLAIELENLNNRRRSITAQALKEMHESLERITDFPDVIFLSGNWPIGILGILAGKLADEYNRPSAVVCVGEEICTGSIRGNGKVDVVEILSGIKQLLTKFGGHFTAGGFSFKTRDLEKIKKYFNNLMVVLEKEKKEIIYDLEIAPRIVDFNLINALKALEPHGEGNNRPVFLLRDLEIKEVRDVGTAKEHKKFIFHTAEFVSGAIGGVAFNWKKNIQMATGQKADVLCEIRVNEFRGNSKIEIMVIDLC